MTTAIQVEIGMKAVGVKTRCQSGFPEKSKVSARGARNERVRSAITKMADTRQSGKILRGSPDSAERAHSHNRFTRSLIFCWLAHFSRKHALSHQRSPQKKIR